MGIAQNIKRIQNELGEKVTLVAVSKYSSDEAVQKAYQAGHRDFGENKAQDLQARRERFPEDIRWHFIGHLQRNKVKYIAPFIHLIHAVDSLRLLQEIDKQAKKCDRIIPVLLQMHIAQEESKFGMSRSEVLELLGSEEFSQMHHVKVEGLMGMATNTSEENQIRSEFQTLTSVFGELSKSVSTNNVEMKILSMGMSNDYKIAVETGSTMVRIGSAVFK